MSPYRTGTICLPGQNVALPNRDNMSPGTKCRPFEQQNNGDIGRHIVPATYCPGTIYVLGQNVAGQNVSWPLTNTRRFNFWMIYSWVRLVLLSSPLGPWFGPEKHWEDSPLLLWKCEGVFLWSKCEFNSEDGNFWRRVEIGFFRQTDWHPTASKCLPNQQRSFHTTHSANYHFLIFLKMR